MRETYTIERLAQNEWLGHALYTVEQRAIPSVVDGLKPVQRFYLYASIQLTSKDFDKVEAVASSVAKLGYHHGESNAADAGAGMAQPFKNNACLVEGRGWFGNRLVPVASAPRYIYSKLGVNFGKFIKDIDLAPIHPDPEVRIPSYYIPVVPLVLVNGAQGIATGFATNIFPRSVKDVKAACIEYLTTGKIKNPLTPSFPEFKGTIEHIEGKSYMMKGVYSRHSKTKLTISEVPTSFTRESYIQMLNDLEDSEQIVGYEDKCGAHGFLFDITLKRSDDPSDADIMKMFKLTSRMTENITVIDHNGKLKVYDSPHDLVIDFCNFRLEFMQKRIDKQRVEVKEKARWLPVKAKFIQLILDEKIKFKGMKKNQVGQQIIELISEAVVDDIDPLLKMNILSLTQEQVDSLLQQTKSVEEEVQYWETTTPEDQFKGDLKGI